MTPDWITYLHLDTVQSELVQLFLIAALAALLLFIAARFITTLMRHITPAGGFLHELAKRIKSPVHVLLPLIAIQSVLSSSAIEVVMIDGLQRVISVSIIAVFTWLALQAVTAVEQFILIKNPVDVSDNLRARKIQTQARVLTKTLDVLVLILGIACILMTFPSVRQFGASLLASAGLAGLVVGFAAKPVLGNLIAGIQIAITQPIRLDDVVIIENEWGRIEEITGTYVVVRLWDSRRLVVPLQWIIENPFQNWTRQTSSLIGTVFFWMDYSIPLAPLRKEMERLCQKVPHLWDGEVCVLQVTDCNERAMQIRVLGSSADSSRNWDLRCYLRENLIAFVSVNYPDSLPRIRGTLDQVNQPDQQQPIITEPQAERQPPV